MASTRKIIKTETIGNQNAPDFNDGDSIPNINTAAISRIVVMHDRHIQSLTVHYTDRAGTTRGTRTSTPHELTMTHREFITKVEGTFIDAAISKLVFYTNKGTQWGPYGNVSQTSTFVWEFGPDMGLLYFTGKANDYIRQLSATFGKYIHHQQVTSVVTYEKQINTTPNTQRPVVLSKFSHNLMSSTVTLLIGADRVQFHVPQSVLCILPFFQAALQGEFREAVEQKIEMPEDDPQIVSALIEFLYTGGYTYAYSQEETDSDDPPADLEEGSFHVGVYATAFKYDCQALVKASLTSFIGVLKQLQGIDVIRLWKTAYAKQLVLSKVNDNDTLDEFRGGLLVLLKDVYTAHGEEMDRTSEEHPALINDLLRLVVFG